MTASFTPTPGADWLIRPLTASDVPHLLHIQTLAYGAHFQESASVFSRRLGSAHQCSLGVERPREPGLLAYAAAYWSAPGSITALDGDFVAPPHSTPPVLYLHDISVLPSLAGQGVAHALISQLMQTARTRQVDAMALVAVQGSARFWQRYGFAAAPVADIQQRALASYGPGAVYMTTRL